MTTTRISCLLINHDKGPEGRRFRVDLAADVIELREKVKEKKPNALQNFDADQLIVWRCKDRLIGLKDQNAVDHVREIFSNEEAYELDGSETIADLALSSAETLLVQMPSDKKRKIETDETVVKRQKLSEERDIKDARRALAPSSAAALPAFQDEQAKRPVLNGRPCHNFGPTVGLFHPVFNMFRVAMTRPEPFSADTGMYRSVKALFQSFADIYDTEAKRIEAIDHCLYDILGYRFSPWEEPGVKSDGVIIESSRPSASFLAIREVNNEIRTASTDPYNQGSLTYRKYWASSSHDRVRNNCYCPSIILAIAGPWMCVLGGVYLEKVVIKPLTDYVWLGGDPFDDERLRFAARLFPALESAISTLESYYRTLKQSHLSKTPRSLLSDMFPYITEYGSKKFTYLSRLALEYPEKLSYKAKLDDEERTVVVKFTSRYNARAHRILVEHHLAPALHYASIEDDKMPTYGGRYMVVMDFFEGKQMQVVGRLSSHQFGKVKEAIALLHKNNLVFGDLRPPNILFAGETVMIVDFDWCGEAEESRYPASLNMAPELGWHNDVGPDRTMKKDHDLHMLAELRRHYCKD